MRLIKPISHDLVLPREERLLADDLFPSHSQKRVALSVTDGKAAIAIWQVSQYMHQVAIGRWFQERRQYTVWGAALSVAAICVVASPKSAEQWGTLALGLAAMAPGGYYMFFLVMRLVDLFRAAREHIDASVIGRAATVVGLLFPCVAALTLGSVEIGVTFGIAVLAVVACLVAVNVADVLYIRLPTTEGRRLLNDIEGFRDFLRSVERLPMDRTDAPADHAGLYEKYLPYAVALEVEQSWCDKFVALKSAFHEVGGSADVCPFYLGMWDGKPVEIVYAPTSSCRGYWADA